MPWLQEGASWRRFVNLLAGLSPYALWRAAIKADGHDPDVISDPQEAERAVARALGV